MQHKCVDMVIIIKNLGDGLHGEWVTIIADIVNAGFITVLKYSCTVLYVLRKFHNRGAEILCDLLE